jgi:flagellar biogenesis protein FliO
MEPFKTIAALAITFGLLGGLIWLLRVFSIGKCGTTFRWNRQPQEQQLRSLEKLALGPDCTLHLVAIGGETMLLAISSKTVVPLHTLTNRPQAFQRAGGVA